MKTLSFWSLAVNELWEVTVHTLSGRIEKRMVRAKSGYDAKHLACKSLGLTAHHAMSVKKVLTMGG